MPLLLPGRAEIKAVFLFQAENQIPHFGYALQFWDTKFWGKDVCGVQVNMVIACTRKLFYNTGNLIVTAYVVGQI